MLKLDHYINGTITPPASGQYLDVDEPATGKVYAHAASGNQVDVDFAVEAATRAFPAWSNLHAATRSEYLTKMAQGIEARLDAFALAEAKDCGKPLQAARTIDIPRSASNLRFFATAILHTSSEMHDFDGGGIPGGQRSINYTLRMPRGVAGCISPWNLPLYLFTWKIAPALASGCTVVAKPSEITPATASMLAEVALEAGLPPGVLNIVHGLGQQAGAAIVQHDGIPTITFTGSTAVGSWIASTAGAKLKRMSLELGGKNAFMIFEDADVENAIATAMRAGLSNQGQICLCGSRLLVHESVAKHVIDSMTQRMRAIVPGDPMELSTNFAALTSRAHLEKVTRMVKRARELGGTVHCGGGPVDAQTLPTRCRDGFYFQPTLISGLDPSCEIEQEEIFGPVITVQTFKTEEEAVMLANGTKFGLAAVVFSNNTARVSRVTRSLQAGVVWVNSWMIRDLRTPFGGMKHSGIGREGGVEALKFFTEPKNICIPG